MALYCCTGYGAGMLHMSAYSNVMAAQAAIHASLRKGYSGSDVKRATLSRLTSLETVFEAGVDGRRPCGAWLRHDERAGVRGCHEFYVGICNRPSP